MDTEARLTALDETVDDLDTRLTDHHEDHEQRIRKLEAVISGMISNAVSNVVNSTTAPASPHAARMGQVVDEQLAQINARSTERGRTR
jgi:hypothetical protein